MRARIVTGLAGIAMTLIAAAAISPVTGAQAAGGSAFAVAKPAHSID